MTPLGRVIPGIAVVQAGFGIVVIAVVADGVGMSKSVIGSIAGDGAFILHLYSTIIYASS